MPAGILVEQSIELADAIWLVSASFAGIDIFLP